MLLRLLRAEQMKLKRSPLWFVFIIIPVIPAILGTANYVYNREILKSEWLSLWTQHTLFTDYFFLPIMLGVYCTYIIRLEHRQNNWNKVFTMPVNRSLIFISKLITATVMLALSEIWIGVLFIISGYIAGLSNPPCQTIILWCLFGTLGGMVMVSIQLLLSMLIQSFALPVGISFAGGLSGLMFLAKNMGHIWPYSLMALGMNSNSPQEFDAGSYTQFVIICLLYITAFTLAGLIISEKRDI